MKAVMHAGGMGIRLSDEMNMRQKPMVKMGDKPILWHIMEIYAVHGINEFFIAVGYKSEMIKEYFRIVTRLTAISRVISKPERPPFMMATVRKIGKFIKAKPVCTHKQGSIKVYQEVARKR